MDPNQYIPQGMQSTKREILFIERGVQYQILKKKNRSKYFLFKKMMPNS